jgi:hypothetical protein
VIRKLTFKHIKSKTTIEFNSVEEAADHFQVTMIHILNLINQKDETKKVIHNQPWKLIHVFEADVKLTSTYFNSGIIRKELQSPKFFIDKKENEN